MFMGYFIIPFQINFLSLVLHWTKDSPPTWDDDTDDDDDENKQDDEDCNAKEFAYYRCYGIFGSWIVIFQNTYISIKLYTYLFIIPNPDTFNSRPIDGTASVYGWFISWEVAGVISEFLQKLTLATFFESKSSDFIC